MNENIFKNSLIVNQLKLVRYCCEYDKSLYNEEYLVNTTTSLYNEEYLVNTTTSLYNEEYLVNTTNHFTMKSTS